MCEKSEVCSESSQISQICEPDDSCSESVIFKPPLKHSQLGLSSMQPCSEGNVEKILTLLGSVLHQVLDRSYDLLDGQACKKSPLRLGCGVPGAHPEHCAEMYAGLEKSPAKPEVQNIQEKQQEARCSTLRLLLELGNDETAVGHDGSGHSKVLLLLHKHI